MELNASNGNNLWWEAIDLMVGVYDVKHDGFAQSHHSIATEPRNLIPNSLA